MDQQKELTFGQKSAITFNLLHCAGRPLMLFCATPGTVGRRHAGNNLNAAWALGIAGVFALYHEAMAAVLALALVVEAIHRAKPGTGVSSFYVGDCTLGNWKAVGVLAMAGGALAFQEPDLGPVGAWLFLAGTGVLSTMTMAERRSQMIDDDLHDAVLEQRARAWRMQQMHSQWEDD